MQKKEKAQLEQYSTDLFGSGQDFPLTGQNGSLDIGRRGAHPTRHNQGGRSSAKRLAPQSAQTSANLFQWSYSLDISPEAEVRRRAEGPGNTLSLAQNSFASRLRLKARPFLHRILALCLAKEQSLVRASSPSLNTDLIPNLQVRHYARCLSISEVGPGN